MSELINTIQKNPRWHLLTTVSMASLLVAIPASAQDTGRPTVWVELGGQLEALQGKEDVYATPFILNNLDAPFNTQPLTDTQHPPGHAFGGEAKLLFRPEKSDWVFSAAVRFGRSNGKDRRHQQTSTQFTGKTFKYPTNHHFATKTVTRFNDTTVKYHTTHTILDFMVGKDVGFGMFGKGGSSTFNLGVRFAQFQRNSDVTFRSLPDPYYRSQVLKQFNFTNFNFNHHHSYYARLQAERSFHGIGPSISWDGSAPVAGHPDAGEVTFDWGANAAVLFGRQRVKGFHKSNNLYFYGNIAQPTGLRLDVDYNNHPITRSRSTIVPNVGGFAGVSVRYPNVKVSLGYRADFFFGAMDQGIDTRDSTTQSFNGPFATVSIGLGG